MSNQKIAIVTGSNKGIGLEIARGFSKVAGYHTILACRSKELGEEALRVLRQGAVPGASLEFRSLDIGNLESIQNFTTSFKNDFTKCDILVNNAAIAFKAADPTPFAKQAAPTLNVNYFGTVELTNQMLSLLPAGARVVNVASMAGHLKILKTQSLKEEFTSPDLTEETLSKIMQAFVADIQAGDTSDKWPKTCYGMSKLGLIAYTKVLSRCRPDLLVNAVCPGWCSTDMSSHQGPRTAQKGAETPLMLALSPSVTTSGGFYQDDARIEW
jgi:carbonyl reductase 1